MNLYINQFTYFDDHGNQISFNQDEKETFDLCKSLLLDSNIKTDKELLEKLEKITENVTDYLIHSYITYMKI